tara:strand:- start:792 stop:2459 length:1668 start_codon:yes stop_codon:yes gene_type:complete
MAKQDPKADIAAMKAAEKLAQNRANTQKELLDLYIKTGKSQEDINKKAKTYENTLLRIAKLKGKQLKLEEKISDEEDSQEKSLYNQLVTGGKILAATQAIKSAVEFISKAQRNTANTMSITLTRAAKLNKEIAKELKFSDMLDTNREEILESMVAMDDLFRTSNLYSANQAKNLSITANKLNISREEATKLSGMMQLIDGSSAEAANTTLALGKNLADANGVKFGKVMKDIANSGKDFANFSGMSLKNMVRTAIETRKMGFELSDAMNVANKLLDIESSIEGQMKFNVLTGKEANFDRARGLVLEGKYAEALQEVSNQVGDISELGILERQTLEGTLGLRGDQLSIANSLNNMQLDNNANIDAANKAFADGNVELAQQLLNKEDATTADEANANAQLNIQESLASQLADQKALKYVMAGMQAIQLALAASSAMKAISDSISATALSFGAAAIPIALGIAGIAAAGYGAYQMVSNMKDGAIDPQGGLLVSGEKGSIQLDKDDSIIAGTNLGGGGNSGMGEKLDKIIQLLSQQRVLNVSGTQLTEIMELEQIPVGVG